MLTEQRYNAILNLVEERGSVTIGELKDVLGISESTARRDITALAKIGKLEKVFGGAMAVRDYISSTQEPSIAQKMVLHSEEKKSIAQFAATLITPDDFIFIDAGTTTLAMLDFIPDSYTNSIVTSGISHAQKLAAKGRHVILLGGDVKANTDAVVGSSSVLMLQQYHFTKGFFGTNGISHPAGFTTPDLEEALTKKTAMRQCRSPFILSDSSKFDVVSSACFAPLTGAKVITERIPDSYQRLENVYTIS